MEFVEQRASTASRQKRISGLRVKLLFLFSFFKLKNGLKNICQQMNMKKYSGLSLIQMLCLLSIFLLSQNITLINCLPRLVSQFQP
jgi:uncharacterized protein YybS (DUF2232 family)